MLKMENISKAFPRREGRVQVLENFSLEVPGGKLVAVQGASGCGKTTLLLVAAGLLRPDTGTVEVAGTLLYSLRRDRQAAFRNRHIGMVFQQFHLLPYLSVRENILVPALLAGEDAGDAADALVERFGLAKRAGHRPAELSTGERQRTALARALLPGPSVLLADEPTANLDHENAQTVLRALADFAREGHAVLMVSHDPRVADFADSSLQLELPRGRA